MNKQSKKSTSNIYLRQEHRLFTLKYSSSNRTQKKNDNRSSLNNKSSKRLTKLFPIKGHPYLNNNKSSQTPKVTNPLRRSQSRTSSMRDFQLSISRKLQIQNAKLQSYQTKSPLKQQEVKKAQSLKKRLDSQQSQRTIKQIQYKYQEAKREHNFKLMRKKSERSFIFETHKESIDMMKKSRHIRSRSQIKLTKDRYYDTEKNHEFLVLKKKINSLKLNYEIKYHKAFLKNEPFKVNKYPNLAQTLAISSKMIGSLESNSKKLSKIQLRSTQKQKQTKNFKHSTKKIESKTHAQNQVNQIKSSEKETKEDIKLNKEEEKKLDIELDKEEEKQQCKLKLFQIKPSQYPEKLSNDIKIANEQPQTNNIANNPEKLDIEIKNT